MSEKLREFINPMRDWKTAAHLIYLPAVRLGDSTIRKAIDAGGYLRLCPEVVVPTHIWNGLKPWEKDEVRIQAVGMSVDKAVLVGRSAARVHGLPVPHGDAYVELNLPGRNRRPPKKQWPTGVRYWSAHLGEENVVERNGLRVTDIPRTLVDIARRHGVEEAIVTCDAALSLKGATKQMLAKRFDDFGPVPGIALAREALELADPRSESPLESWGRAQIVTADLPELISLDVQVPVLGGKHRIDQVLNGSIANELHGDVKYDGATTGTDAVTQMKKDRERERVLQNEGYHMLHAGYRHLVRKQGVESEFIGMVREALRAERRKAA